MDQLIDGFHNEIRIHSPESPLQLEGDDLKQLQLLVEELLSSATSGRKELDERVAQWRRYHNLDKRTKVPWEGAPNVTTPFVRQKTDGMEAHLIAAINLDPMFSAKPYSAEAEKVQIAFETAMERELDRTNSRPEIFSAIHDAVVTGTGHLKHVVLDDGQGGWVCPDRYVRFEDLYVWPTGTHRRHQLSYFERYYKSFWEISEDAGLGVYDEEAIEKLRAEPGVESISNNQDNTVHELWQCYIRFRADLWVIDYHRLSQTILAAYPYPYSRFFNYAPYTPIYTKRDPGSYYGRSIPSVLESLQEVSDAAFNNELASAQFKMRPLGMVRRNSAIARKLKETGGVIPGGFYEVDGPLDEAIKVLDFNANPFNYQMLMLIGQMAEDATFSDMIVPGDPTGGKRVTATWARLSSSVASMKLRMHLITLQECLAQHADDKWRLIYHYVVKPKGIYEIVGPQSTIRLASESVTLSDGTFIPGAMRDDIQWIVKGGDTVPDKDIRLSKLLELIQLMPMIQQAQVSRPVWFILRNILETMDIFNWKEIIGPMPPPAMPMMPGMLPGGM